MLVDGRSTRPSARLRRGQAVSVLVPAPEPALPRPEDIPLEVLHEDASLLVVNKPAGRGTHVPWHQDGGDVWGLDRDPLMTIWVALDPATRETGCLQVIPGTHRLGLLSRDRSALSAESARSHCPEEAIVHLEIEAGEALLLHNWVVRRSGVNETSSRHRAFTACYMDGRTLSTLTGDRFPIVFGEHEDGEEALPFVGGLKDEVRLLRATAEEAVRYAVRTTPEGWVLADGDTIWGDLAIYLGQPGYGTSYVTGKVQVCGG